MNRNNRKITPWSWIPTLYIAEGLPYFAVNTLTVLMYTNLGIGLKEMAFFTGWLYLPWVIKPFWSPFVDIIKTKRYWVIITELLIALSMFSVALFLQGSLFFTFTLICFWLMAFLSATHDIAADGYYMLELTAHEQAAYVGLRSTFYRIASVIGQGGIVVFAGYLERSTANFPLAWGIVFSALSILFLLVTIYHHRILPRPKEDVNHTGRTPKEIIREFGMTFVTFFNKPHIISALAFMLLYRLPEAMCIKLIQPFLVTPTAEGGLGLTTIHVGIANGTVGVIALLAGGILGGIAISRGGLKQWMWPMALSLTLPCALYCVLAALLPTNFLWICVAIGIEQFGYGFGFTAFMLYLVYFSQGELKTSHYAFCTAFMALGMMLPGMAAGWIFEKLENIQWIGLSGPHGYFNFFCWVMLCSLVTFLVTFFVKIDKSFGKKLS